MIEKPYPTVQSRYEKSTADVEAPRKPEYTGPDTELKLSKRNRWFWEALVKFRLPLLVMIHAVIFTVAYWLAYCLRFDFAVPAEWTKVFWTSLTPLLIVELGIFLYFKTFNGWWRYVTFRDFVSISRPLIVSFLTFGILDYFFLQMHVPRSVHIMNLIVAGLMICVLRSSWRLAKEGLLPHVRLPKGCTGAFVICNHPESYILAHQVNNRFSSKVRIVGILSDDERNIGSERAGIKIVGSPEEATYLSRTHGVQEVWVVAGDITGKRISELKEEYDQFDLKLRVMPQTLDMESNSSLIPLREIDINDLLQREPVVLDTKRIAGEVNGKCVMITGAGGSIGSELCRQLLRFEPSKLILVDHRENSVFMINNELSRLKTDTTILEPAVGDILDEARMRVLMETYQPSFVYHAAAHKHVGLMELSEGQAIQNNILGTKQIADLANEYGVTKFVLISTDKAVNPTSVMGCTKQIAERYTLALGQESKTKFVVVRFGNVLGSNGSVVPLFKEQIARGGPVTITDRRMTRFFMTIPEASQLVLQAAAMGVGGEIFVLDMGEQVKVLDLAKKMVKLAGLPEHSIEFEFIGARPGEKLYEELYFDEEEMLNTDHEKIFAAYHRNFEYDEIVGTVSMLRGLVSSPSVEIRAALKRIVPDYQSAYDSSEPNNSDNLLEKKISELSLTDTETT